MEIKKIKCSSTDHMEIDANSYCQECKVYICNKCEIFHSKLCKNHHIFVLEKDNEDIFTGFCKNENHNCELIFFCKNHNILCCAACVCKIKIQGFGIHKDCDICLIKDIKDEKINKLKDNIKSLEELSKTLEESINNLKIIIEKINSNKEELKLKIQKVFTKIRNELNNREDELLYEVDNIYQNLFFNDEIIKESEKLPKKIKLSLEKRNILDKEYNENRLNLLINDCINIEKNIKDINDMKYKIKKSNDSINLKIQFFPEEEKEINNFILNIKKFGKVKELNKSLLNNKEDLIINWIREKTNKNHIKFELIYKMSEKGNNCEDFHKYCDNKGATLILIKANKNKIFGGFTPLNWKNSGGSLIDESKQTFIFSLNLNKKYDLIDQKKLAIQCQPNYGPIFGAHDFSLSKNMKSGETYANSICNFLSNNNLELIEEKGIYKIFETNEFEVYQVIFKDD